MSESSELTVLAGVASVDMTPPLGIYSRQWGAAPHDVATELHHPLSVRALVLREDGHDAGSKPLIVLAFDLCEWAAHDESLAVRTAVTSACGIDPERLLLHCTHTHSAPPASAVHEARPGGIRLPAFVRLLTEAAAEAASSALSRLEPCRLRWAGGAAVVARNRDQWTDGRWVVGRNDDDPVDQTVLVGRLTSAVSGDLLGVLVNFACHPTVLGWENAALSPDYVAALRDRVEQEVGGLCIFWQGAGGEIAPLEQYSGDLTVADRVGRSVAHTVLSVLDAMPPPGLKPRYARIVESGAPLGVWTWTETETSGRLHAETHTLMLPRKPGTVSRWEDLPERTRRERLDRQALVEAAAHAARGEMPDAEDHQDLLPLTLSLWWLGDALVVAVPCEAYSWLQTHLRAELSDQTVVVMNLTNGSGAYYLPPAQLFERDMYTVWQTPAGPGALEQIAELVLIRARERATNVSDASRST